MKHIVTEVELENGARGLLIHIPGASVMSYEISFRAGEFLVDENKWEAPHLMEHILLGANEQYPRTRDFQSEFEKNGAYSNASTGTYDITYEAECADFEWDRILQLLLLSISKPLFLADEFLAEFGNVTEELTSRSNNHFRHLCLALRNQYGFKVKTDQERLELMYNVTVNDIVQHYKNTHTTSNLRFVFAGKLTAVRKKKIEKLMSTIALPEGDGRKVIPPEIPKRLNRPLYIVNDTIDNLYFYLDTFTKHALSDKHIDSLSLLNSMLTETYYSRILGAARERGLVYHLSSGVGNFSHAANWWFAAQILPQNISELYDIIVSEIQDVLAGNITSKEMRAAKQYALGKHQRSGQTVSGILSAYSNRYFFDEVIEDHYQVPRRIRAINRDLIVDAAQEMFADNVWGLGVLGVSSKQSLDALRKQLSVLWK